MQTVSRSLEDTQELGRTVAARVARRSRGSKAMVIGLYGDLGAGKTAFTKQFSKTLGVLDEVTSPTFVIFRRYSLQNLPHENLFHFDFYRLSEFQELNPLGWSEIISNPRNLVLVEWLDNIPEAVVPDVKIIFEHQGGNQRQILIEPNL